MHFSAFLPWGRAGRKRNFKCHVQITVVHDASLIHPTISMLEYQQVPVSIKIQTIGDYPDGITPKAKPIRQNHDVVYVP